MADAEVTRVIAAPLRAVRKTLDRLNSRDGSPTATWNATKTEMTDVSPDGTIAIKLAAVDAGNTSVTIGMTANDPQMSMMLQMIGAQFLEQAMDEISTEVTATLGGAGDIDL